VTSNNDQRRHLKLEGTRNIRDLGGYRTIDGRTTRWNTMLRADNLEKLTPDGQRELIEYGVRTVIDLRQTIPMLRSPNPFSKSTDVRYTHQNLMGDIPIDLINGDYTIEALRQDYEEQRIESPDTSNLGDLELTKQSYCMWLDYRKGQFCETLATLATPDLLPALFHCNGGKDRTGLIAALVLGLAGVPKETIAEDYAITGKYLLSRHVAAEAKIGNDVSDMTWQEYRDLVCPPEIMYGALGHIEQRYGGIEEYAVEIGLSSGQIASIREVIVE